MEHRVLGGRGSIWEFGSPDFISFHPGYVCWNAIFRSTVLVVLLATASSCYSESNPAPQKNTEVSNQNFRGILVTPFESDLRGTASAARAVEAITLNKDKLDKEEEVKHREQNTKTNLWLMYFTAGMCVIAFVQAFLFFWQLKLMKKSILVAEGAASAAAQSVETMRDTTRRQLRAYLSIDKANIEFPQPGVPRATVIIKNSG